MATRTEITVTCPLCNAVVEVPEYDKLTRTDALIAHIITSHASQLRPATPLEGPPLPWGLNIRWPWKKDK